MMNGHIKQIKTIYLEKTLIVTLLIYTLNCILVKKPVKYVPTIDKDFSRCTIIVNVLFFSTREIRTKVKKMVNFIFTV